MGNPRKKTRGDLCLRQFLSGFAEAETFMAAGKIGAGVCRVGTRTVLIKRFFKNLPLSTAPMRCGMFLPGRGDACFFVQTWQTSSSKKKALPVEGGLCAAVVYRLIITARRQVR